MQPLVILGPQTTRPNLDEALRQLGVQEGPFSVITAGWQEREAEIEALAAYLPGSVTNLRLHARSEEVFHSDPELAQAHRNRQQRLKELRRVYRIRLSHQLASVYQVFGSGVPEDLLEAEIESAVGGLRALDDHHLSRLAQTHGAFRAQWAPRQRALVDLHRRQLTQILGDSRAVLVAGGHVATLLNRLLLFDIRPLLRSSVVVAWSAGAMALAEKVVLFHDSPPQGRGDAELFEVGLGLYGDILPFPHASQRLHLEDAVRVSVLVRRFRPFRCAALDPGSHLIRTPSGTWEAPAPTRLLEEPGKLQETL